VTSVNTVQKDFDSAPLFGVGVGYQFNNWLRTDVTGEYRGKANFHGLDIVRSGATTYTDEYRGSKSEWLVLANIYADLGTWYSFTPFIGAGIGASYNTISNFLDVCTTCAGGGVAYGATASKWNFAWALHAGVSYRVNSQLSFEFAYRYVNLGDAMSGDLVAFNGTNAIYNPMEFKDITSHDLKFGVRWLLDAPMPDQPVMLPPLMRRG
jgi:opacity protein-like surface antigen